MHVVGGADYAESANRTVQYRNLQPASPSAFARTNSEKEVGVAFCDESHSSALGALDRLC